MPKSSNYTCPVDITALCQHSTYPVVHTDSNGKIQHLSEPAKVFLTAGTTRWKKQPLLKVIPLSYQESSSQIAHFDQLVSLSHSHASQRPMIVSATSGSGDFHSFILNQISFTAENQSEREYLWTFIDITRYQRMEDSLYKAEKAEAISYLAGSLAHDFNNLLSLISSYSDLLMLNLDLNNPLRRYAQAISSSAQKGSNLIKTFSAISKHNGSMELTEVDLTAMITDIETLLGKAIGSRIKIANHFDSSHSSVLADPIQLELALINLFINARDAMEGKGRIDVYLREQAMPEDLPDAGISAGSYIVLAIQDTGSGIDPMIIDSIFEPFFTTKPEGQGTGLGLSTVRNVMERCGGFVLVNSLPGQGARFELFFPA
jgi:signal transduction histidine kinase